MAAQQGKMKSPVPLSTDLDFCFNFACPFPFPSPPLAGLASTRVSDIKLTGSPLAVQSTAAS